MTIEGMHIDRIVAGKIAEHWSSPDLLGLLQQLARFPAGPLRPDRIR
jgi:hypothetical protein